jgi:hypothetical protein
MHGTLSPVRSEKRPRWTESEIAIVRERYPVGGLDACRLSLPMRNEGSIYQMAQTLKLKAPGQPVSRERWTSTEQIDDVIRRA